MNSEQPKKQYFWPVIFLSAFVLGAALWVLWMYHIVQKTRSERENNFFVPQANQSVANPTNTAVTKTN